MQDSTAAAGAAAAGTDTAKLALLGALAVVTVLYVAALVGAILTQRRAGRTAETTPGPIGLLLGFVTNFFDTLGIGSFAPTTSAFRFLKMVPDEKIPGTLNVGHTLPTILQTFFFTTAIEVDSTTLIAMIISAVVGSWLGAGVVAGLSRQKVQMGMGMALFVAAIFLLLKAMGLMPAGGNAVGVSGGLLLAGMAGNFVLGALMTLGIGLYAPCIILVSALGMKVSAAFPIMMGSCAFLMPLASAKFMKVGGFDPKAALGLAIGGIPAVWLAVKVVKSLELNTLMWLVSAVILYTSITLLRAAQKSRAEAAAGR